MHVSSSPLIAGILAAAALGATAFAQDAAPGAQVPAAQPPAAPVAQDPAAVQPPVDAAPAAPQSTATAEEPPPTLPTTGDGAVIVDLLSKVCRPAVEGQGTFDSLAKAAGMTRNRRNNSWVKPLEAKTPYQVEIVVPSPANKNVCTMNVRYAPASYQTIMEAMNIWRFLERPQLKIRRNDIASYDDAQRTTTTWDNWENQSFDGKMIGLILVKLDAATGATRNANYDEALIQYSQRKALPAAQSAVPAPAPPPAAPAEAAPAQPSLAPAQPVPAPSTPAS